MYIVKEIALKDFPFWGQGARNAALLTEEELDMLEYYFEDEVPYDETSVNDKFAYEFDHICDLLCLDIDEVYARGVE